MTDLYLKWNHSGKKAAREDGWMHDPYFNEFSDEDLFSDQAIITHNDQWEATTHFQLKYHGPIYNDAMDVHPDDTEARHELTRDLCIAFWEGYDDTAGTVEKLKAERKRRKERSAS